MNCTQVRELLTPLAYDELSEAEKTAVEAHLSACVACRDERTAIQEARRLLDMLPAPRTEVDLARLYHDAGRIKDIRARRWKRVALAAVAGAAVILLGLIARLEVRVHGHEVVIRWGSEKKLDVPAPQLADAGPETFNDSADSRLVKDLIHVLAAEMDSRDERHREALLSLRRQIDQLQASTESYVSALHSWQIEAKGKGE